MYSAYKLNKQGDNIRPWCTPFPIWNKSVFPRSVLTVASWPAYRFLKRQVRWSGISISWRIFHSFLWSTQSKTLAFEVNEADVDAILEFSCFFCDPTDIGNLISGSSAFSKSSLKSGSSCFAYCWRLSWRILSIITLLACDMCAIVGLFQYSLALPFFGIGMKTDLFESSGHCWVFQICWHVWICFLSVFIKDFCDCIHLR